MVLFPAKIPPHMLRVGYVNAVTSYHVQEPEKPQIERFILQLRHSCNASGRVFA